MKNKYNFDLIISNEDLKANRLRHLEQDKNKKSTRTTLIVLSIIVIFLGLMIYHDQKESYKKALTRCETEQKELVEYYRYDGEKDYTCQ